MNIPNIITILRIVFIIPLIYIFGIDNPNKNYIILIVFIVISLSDWLDGYLARKLNQVTSLGKLLDPIADKALVLTMLVYLIIISVIDIWMVVVIVIREFAVTIARLVIAPKGNVVAASILGKAKTFFQIIAIAVSLVSSVYGWWLMLIAVILTVVSGLDYLYSIIFKEHSTR